MFFRRFAKAERLELRDAHEFILDCLGTAIAGIHGAKSIRAKRLDDETIELLIRDQLYIVRIEEGAQALARKVAKRANKKTSTKATSKTEGQSDAG